MELRPTWDDYFFEVMEAVSKRASCDRGKSGAVVVKNNQILATGYVGSAAGTPSCDEAGHLMRKYVKEDGTIAEGCRRTVHAELNAILQAARNGVAIDGASIYCRMTPCYDCAMAIINSGIRKVYAQWKYREPEASEELFRLTGVELVYLHNEVLKY